MKIDLNELNYKKEILIDQKMNFKNTYSGIKEVKDAYFSGRIFIDTTEEVKLEGVLKADLVLIDAVDLSDYYHKIEVNIEEILSLDQKILDINEILWENIVLEVPIRVTNHESNPQKGKGWEIKNNDSLDQEIDPRLEKLQDLFKGGE